MKDYLFIITHHGAGGNLLARVLNSTNKLAIITHSNIVYGHLDDLKFLDMRIKYDPRMKGFVPIYGDVIKENDLIYCEQMFNFCKFIFLLRPPEQTLKYIYPKYSYDHYRFRLRKMYILAKKAKQKICVTYDDIVSKQAYPAIESFLNLKEPITGYYETFSDDYGDIALGKAQKLKEPDIYVPTLTSGKYEKYLNAMKKLN